jgi:hypothetical protein
VVVSAIVAAVALAGCGGSSSSDERAKLSKKVSAELQSSTAPPDITSCVSRQAQGLPIDQLRALANAGANPPPAIKQTAVRLLATCLSQGQGVSAVRGAIASAIAQSMPSTLPVSYRNCVVAKANTIAPSELAQLATEYASGNQAAVQSQSHQFGVNFGLQCLQTPNVLSALRGVYLDTIKKGFASSHYSPAFRNCLLHKLEAVPTSLLKQSALNPSGASAAGQAFGRRAAKACIASGIKP